MHGFRSKISALQFEWAWQHPTMSRFLKGALSHLHVTKRSHSSMIRCTLKRTASFSSISLRKSPSVRSSRLISLTML